MRSHGVSDFPDPIAPGSVVPSGGNSYLGNGPNPNTSPTYQAASAACRKYAVATPVTPAGAAQFQAENLKFAQCMRTHGEPDFPDPSSAGGFTIPNTVDQNSSIFQAALHDCGGIPKPPGVPGSPP